MIIEEILVNLVFIIGLIAAVSYLAWKIYNFIKMPKVDKFEAVREWLLWAVAEAEKLYGSGTGALKLRYVYDLFLSRFKGLEYFIPFNDFSKMVDDSLVGFRDLLGKNEKINNYVEGSNEEAK